MVGQKLIGPILVAVAAVGTLFVARHFIQKAGGEEPLPPVAQNTPSIPAGSLGTITIAIEKVQKAAFDFFIFNVRFSNLADEAQTFEVIMQIKDPKNFVVVFKTQKITVEARSSRLVRFSSGNLFELSTLRGIWLAEFFAWQSLELPILLSDSVTTEFAVDVL